MIKRFIQHALLPAVLLALVGAVAPARAADPEPTGDQQADWPRRLEQGAAMQAEGAARRAAAERALAEKNAACGRKFLVNACRDAAHQEYVTANREALRLESEGKAIERRVRQEQLAERDRQRAAEAPQHDADLKRREESTAAAQQAHDAKRAAAQADKAARAERGARRKAEDAERLRRRQAEHDARVAEKMRAAAQRRDPKPGSP